VCSLKEIISLTMCIQLVLWTVFSLRSGCLSKGIPWHCGDQTYQRGLHRNRC